MRWEDERYVRVYTRDTLTWRQLGWQGQCCLSLLLRKVDRAGVMEIGPLGPADAISIATDLPPEIAIEGWRRLELTKTVVLREEPRALILPNFIEAQEATSSDKARQQKHRDMARVTNRDVVSQGVTNGHEKSQAVTSGHAASQPVTPNLAVLSSAVPSRAEPKERKIVRPPKEAGRTVKTREAYLSAFLERHGTLPFASGLPKDETMWLAKFVDEIGQEEAPAVAEFYVRHPDSYYAKEKHPLKLMYAKAGKLRSEWAGAKIITRAAAVMQDKTQENFDGWNNLLTEAK